MIMELAVIASVEIPTTGSWEGKFRLETPVRLTGPLTLGKEIKVLLTWDYPSTRSVITSWVVYDNGNEEVEFTGAPSITLRHVSPGKHVYRVTAKNEHGESKPSNTVEIDTLKAEDAVWYVPKCICGRDMAVAIEEQNGIVIVGVECLHAATTGRSHPSLTITWNGPSIPYAVKSARAAWEAAYGTKHGEEIVWPRKICPGEVQAMVRTINSLQSEAYEREVKARHSLENGFRQAVGKPPFNFKGAETGRG